MKKIFTFGFLAFAAIGISQAQRTQGAFDASKQISSPKLSTANRTPKLTSPDKVDESRWLNYSDQLNEIYTVGLATYNFAHLFPDSNVVLGLTSGGEVVYAWNHKMATYLDPKNMPDPWISATDNYTLDSVAIQYAYLRNLNVADTLLIQVIKHDPSLIYTNSGNTFTYQDITYDQPANSVTGSLVLASYKYVLEDKDSSNSANIIQIATPGIPQQSGQNRIGVVVSFIPGFTYGLTDTLSSMKNAFYVLSSEQNGDNTDQVFYGTVGDGATDMNQSYNLPVSVRYNVNANGWNGYFIPALAYTTGYAYENHLIYFLITQKAGSGVENNELALSNFGPNPSNNVVNVEFNLNKAGKAAIEILDINGKKLFNTGLTSMQAGVNKMSIETASLAAGQYFISITTEEGKTVKKLSVQH